VQIQPIVVGTAGHIDHGKSSLVKALTGIDPDRLKEEKERGLTIDLGFARLPMPDGRWLGLVDVPGHERFVRNMVAGATGIDVVVLVVAADDGVMPQTREHLDIMGLLGLERGLIALNKIDLVDEDMAELAAADVRAAVAGTFLESAPLLRVSAATGRGLDELKRELFRIASTTTPRSDEGVFRMPVQRVFSARGFGTVLTGIPVSGRTRIGDVLEVLPARAKGKVRGIQAYAQTTDTARAGHSTALNLADVDHHQVVRGHVVATPGFFAPVKMVGARLRVLASLEFPVTDSMHVRLHTGTADPLGELVLLDAKELAPGAEGLAQIRLEEELVCAPGDRFVLRLASPSITLGGGTILEESRHRLKRFKEFVIAELERQELSLDSPGALLETTLARAGIALSPASTLAQTIKRPVDEAAAELEALRARGVAVALGSPPAWMHAEHLSRALDRVRDAVARWFADNPHRQVIETLELKRATAWEAPLLAAVLDEAHRRGELSLEPGGHVRARGRKVELDPATAEQRARVLEAFESAGFSPPSAAELAARVALPEKRVGALIQMLVDEGSVRSIGKELFMASAAVERAREAVIRNCTAHGHLEIPQLRDELGTSRKYLIPLLEHFDAKGVTTRLGANRVLKKR
jgi:selenocysteine-specific elongation factor